MDYEPTLNCMSKVSEWRLDGMYIFLHGPFGTSMETATLDDPIFYGLQQPRYGRLGWQSLQAKVQISILLQIERKCEIPTVTCELPLVSMQRRCTKK